MKKIYTILLAGTALVAAASCAKINAPLAEDAAVKINITVGDLEPGTRAVKTGWTTGDKINIWFDGASSATPHLIISYDGTQWTSGSIDSAAEAALKTDGSGTFKYLYEGGNDISAYQIIADYLYFFPSGTIGTKDYFAPELLVCSPDTDPTYSFDGSTLSLNLSEWWYITNAQVVVTGLSGNPEDWYLSVHTGSSDYWDSIQVFLNETGTPGFSFGHSSSAGRATRGASNADGVAFYMRIANASYYNVASNSSSADHTFTLGNATTQYHFTKESTPITSAFATDNPSATNQEKLGRTFTAIKIPFTKFATP